MVTRIVILVFFFLFLKGLRAQTFPELVFKNPVLISGTAGQDGAKYRFSNIATDFDALVSIKGRSSSAVVLGSIDSAGIGWDKAFQPYVGIPSVGPNQEWWMEFRVEFVKAGTTQKKKINSFFVTGIDIDGDNGNLSEWVEMKAIKDVSVSSATVLTTNLLNTIIDLLNDDLNGCDYRINGPISNFTNIDTAATAAMATYEYEKKDKFDFMIGGRTNANGGSPVAMRMNSLWFREFNLNPSLTMLPVKLINFSASYYKNKVELKWATSQEKDFSHFIVQRSTDGKQFSDAGLIFTGGESDSRKDYSFNDVNLPSAKTVYYRLEMHDKDGEVNYSSIRMIKQGADKNTMTIAAYPNPVLADANIKLPSGWQGKEVKFEVIDNGGMTVRSTMNKNPGQVTTIRLADLPTGIYYIKATCGAESAQQKIIKN